MIEWRRTVRILKTERQAFNQPEYPALSCTCNKIPRALLPSYQLRKNRHMKWLTPNQRTFFYASLLLQQGHLLIWWHAAVAAGPCLILSANFCRSSQRDKTIDAIDRKPSSAPAAHGEGFCGLKQEWFTSTSMVLFRGKFLSALELVSHSKAAEAWYRILHLFMYHVQLYYNLMQSIHQRYHNTKATGGSKPLHLPWWYSDRFPVARKSGWDSAL